MQRNQNNTNESWYALLAIAEEEWTKLGDQPLTKPLPFSFPPNEQPPRTLNELRERYFQNTKTKPASKPTNQVRFFDSGYAPEYDDSGVFKKPAKRPRY